MLLVSIWGHAPTWKWGEGIFPTARPEAIHCAVKKYTIFYAVSDGNMIMYVTI